MIQKQVREETGIVHLRADRERSLTDLLEHADYAPSAIAEWLHWGCIYVDGVRRREDVCVNAEQIVRLHTRPKHYVSLPLALRERILFTHEEFYVLDKPGGLPTHPTLDNFIENAKYLLEQELGETLYITHRLDVVTEGLLIIARNPGAQAALNKAFAKRRVEKMYRALSPGILPAGTYTDFMDPESRVPKRLSREPVDNWWMCRLEILKSEPWGEGAVHEIRLETGKTHQIRAQLSARGQPVWGDQAYGSTQTWPGSGIALECLALRLPFRNERFEFLRGAGSLLSRPPHPLRSIP